MASVINRRVLKFTFHEKSWIFYSIKYKINILYIFNLKTNKCFHILSKITSFYTVLIRLTIFNDNESLELEWSTTNICEEGEENEEY